MALKRVGQFRGRPLYAKRRKGVYRRRFVKRVARVMKTVALRQSETKYHEFGFNDWRSLFHNGGSVQQNALLAIPNLTYTGYGTNGQTRVGNEVIARGIAIKLGLIGGDASAGIAPNVSYRIIVYKAPLTCVSEATCADLLDTSLTTNVPMVYLNSEKYTVLRDLIVKPFPTDYSRETGASNSRPVRWIKMYVHMRNERIQYHVGTGDPKKHYVHLAVFAYQEETTTLGTVVGRYVVNGRFYFKDP